MNMIVLYFWLSFFFHIFWSTGVTSLASLDEVDKDAWLTI
jgi:hypothetical protein